MGRSRGSTRTGYPQDLFGGFVLSEQISAAGSVCPDPTCAGAVLGASGSWSSSAEWEYGPCSQQHVIHQAAVSPGARTCLCSSFSFFSTSRFSPLLPACCVCITPLPTHSSCLIFLPLYKYVLPRAALPPQAPSRPLSLASSASPTPSPLPHPLSLFPHVPSSSLPACSSPLPQPLILCLPFPDSLGESVCVNAQIPLFIG